jgi:cytolysin-activating lysine-acyltransferase
MTSTKLLITAPALAKGAMSEAEVLGSVVWLLLQSPRYQEMPLSDVSRLILPAIKQQQYILAATSHQGQIQPCAFVTQRRHSPRLNAAAEIACGFWIG